RARSRGGAVASHESGDRVLLRGRAAVPSVDPSRVARGARGGVARLSGARRSDARGSENPILSNRGTVRRLALPERTVSRMMRRRDSRFGAPALPSSTESHASLMLVADEPGWVARIRGGDSAAFEALFRAHYNGLCVFAVRMLGSSGEAEEIVQDVFFH